jgi:alanyl-tRNA synthetase
MLKASDIRRKYLDFFIKKGHFFQESASLVPLDTTVLLTIAGMVPFKPFFLGEKDSPHSRVTSAQKCIRTNDLENVGKTPRHHTFFEMLGNFSFGDYFKKEAIDFAWEFLTNELSLDKEKLYISVYEEDTEAIVFWKKVTGFDEKKIFKLGKEHNFWQAGPTGPCGPCSEIYFDTGIDELCSNIENCAPGCDCNRFLEIWNLVFMEFNQDKEEKLHLLPKKNIDTGMGLERIASVVQGVSSNFETDLFANLIKKINSIKEVSNIESERVVADHVRAITFMIGDKIFPSNDGRGYVLKKIIRRAILHGRKLGIKGNFLVSLAALIIEEYSEFYKELEVNKDLIKEIILTEENNFSKTLENGLELLSQFIEKDKKVSGEITFKLFDTYGFPLDFTQEIALEKGIKVDIEEFNDLMEEQKERSRENATFYKEGEKPLGGEAIIAKNDKEKIEMARNHSATHLLQNALRKILGTHVSQAGSMVSPERLRFDFINPKALTKEEIEKAEEMVNNAILKNTEVNICHKPYKQAMGDGAIAFFTEKYGDEVRVVSIDDSIELCGGTHVSRTGDIGLFKIISESSISSGVRRIEALTGNYAFDYLNTSFNVLHDIAYYNKTTPEKLSSKINDLETEVKRLKKTIESLNKQKIEDIKKNIIKEARNRDILKEELNLDITSIQQNMNIAQDIFDITHKPTAICSKSKEQNIYFVSLVGEINIKINVKEDNTIKYFQKNNVANYIIKELDTYKDIWNQL